MDEIIELWLSEFLDRNDQTPTINDILEEIEEVKGTIHNEHIWELGYTGKNNPHTKNILQLQAYRKELEELLTI